MKVEILYLVQVLLLLEDRCRMNKKHAHGGTMAPMIHATHPTVFNFEPCILQSHLQLSGKLVVDIKFVSQ